MSDKTFDLNLSWRHDLATAYQALESSVAAIGDDQWHLPTPCSEWDVTQVVQHATGDQLAYAAALGVGAGPAYDPFQPSGTIDGSPIAFVHEAIEQTAAAWAFVADTAETVPTPLPHGDLPTPVAALMCALDAAVHAWDIAIATGQRSPLTDDLAERLLAASKDLIEPLRQWGAYAAIIDSQPGDTATDTLLRFLGRVPQTIG